MANEFKLVRSKVKPKSLEVNIDTVYIRTQFRKLEELDGWEYQEKYMDKDEYFESLVPRSEYEGTNNLLQGLLMQVMDLQMKVDELSPPETPSTDEPTNPEPEPEPEPEPTPTQLKQVTEGK